MKYILNFRDKPTGGAVVPWCLEQRFGCGSIDDLRIEDNITFLIHGFNVNEKDGREKLTNLTKVLGIDVDGGLVSVLWPGDHWVNALSYPFEGRDADDTSLELLKFIDQIPKDIPLSFVAHSLGSRVAMNVVDRLRDRGNVVSKVCLMAAAIDNYSLSSKADYFNATGYAEKVFVLTSKKDTVLRFAYPAGDLLQAFLFLEDDFGMALGLKGPKQRKRFKERIPGNVVHEPISKKRKCGHGDYLPDIKPNFEQVSASEYVKEVLKGNPKPKYI